eukprot:2034625-Rhodomonas_salina.2
MLDVGRRTRHVASESLLLLKKECEERSAEESVSVTCFDLTSATRSPGPEPRNPELETGIGRRREL